MGPKGKSKALVQHQQKSREIGNLTVVKNRMDEKIKLLKSELSVMTEEAQDLTFFIQTKNCELTGLKEEILNLTHLLNENQNTKDELTSSLQSIKSEISCLNSQIYNETRKLKRKQNLLTDNRKKANIINMSKRSVTKRKAHPYSSKLTNKLYRCKEVIHANKMILGGSDQNMQPVLDGMLDSMTRHFSVSNVLKTISDSNEPKIQQLNHGFMTSYNNEYFKSDENKLRSLSTYYAHDVLGKRKYLSMRKANRKSIFRAERIPNYISYSSLSTFINTIDIGELHPLYSDDRSKILGMYRDLKSFIPRLASFYLHVNEHRSDKLLFFDKFPRKDPASVLFLIAFGGDGAPGIGTIFNVSFLNAGKRIMSSSETFTVLGGDFSETSHFVRDYVLKVTSDFRYLEENIFPIEFKDKTVNVEFKFAEFPNDMKFLYFLAGELSNSARYFTTFANVCLDDYMDINKSFGSDWKPFPYQKRIQDSEKIADLKKKLSPNISKDTFRNKVRDLAFKLNSRQEHVPLIQEYIDLAKCEPLHLKNNICKDYFNKVFKQICSLKPTKVKLFKELPSDDIFYIFVMFVKTSMKLNLLSTKLITWFNETKRDINDFRFRFRGEESFGFLNHFPLLFKSFLPYFESRGDSYSLQFMRLFRQLICVRRLISYSVRLYNFTQGDLDQMMLTSKQLVKYVCFESATMTPSLWVLCHVSPHHAKKTLELYGLGLGVNSMEPREQKHQRLKKYAENATYQDKWKMIFRHEFVQLVYLRENGYDEKNYNRKSRHYLPLPTPETCHTCGFSLENELCSLCLYSQCPVEV